MARVFGLALVTALSLLARPSFAADCPADTEEHIEILESGFIRWCEGPSGETFGRQRFDAMGALVVPERARWPSTASSTVADSMHQRHAVGLGPRARPFAFSNLGPGRGKFVSAFGLRFFPTLADPPIPELDFSAVWSPVDRLKLVARVTVAGLVNAVDLTFSPRIAGGPNFSVAPRLGVSLLTHFGRDWNVGFGPRTGLAISFGVDDAQITMAGEIVGYLAGAGRDSPDRSRYEATWRAQLAGEFDLSPTVDRRNWGDGPTSVTSERVSLFIELALERPLFESSQFSTPLIFSTSIGAVY